MMPISQTIRLTRNLILHVHRTQPARTNDAFDPAKHPRGHQGNTGEFSKSGGGSKQQTQQTKPSINQQQQHTTQSGKLTREQLMGDLGQRIPPQSEKQNVRDLDDLYAKAKKDEPQFVQSLNQIAHSVGAEAHFTPSEYAEPGTTLKSRKSAERKMNNEYGGDPTQLRDIIRGTVVSDRIENVRAAAAQFIEWNKANIVKVKDRIVNPTTEGYRDIAINFRTPSGLIAEVQFNTPVMIREKDLGDGHKIYEKLRDLKANPDFDQAQRDALIKRSQEVYNQAYQEGGNGNWGRS
jgi:hypothetical protein